MRNFEGGESESKNGLGVGYKEKTVCGGFLAMMAWALLISEFALTVNSIFMQRDNYYKMNEIFVSSKELSNTEISLDHFKNSGKFFFGLNGGETNNTNFDILNNPYVEIEASTTLFA